MTTVEEALGLAGRGLHVFPLPLGGKVPTVKWKTSATTDPKMIASWFAGTSLNVGVSCGPSGIVALDEDVRGDLDKLAATHGKVLPSTYTVGTSRGRHLYFAAGDTVIGNGVKLGGLGVDVRGVGGYVVGAGSVHATGEEYRVTVDAAFAPLPTWVADLAAVRGTDPVEHRVGGLAGVLDVIPAGQRHHELVRYAGRLRNRDQPYAEARVLVTSAWGRCEQPSGNVYPVAAAIAIVDDVWDRYPPGAKVPAVHVFSAAPDVETAGTITINEEAFWSARPVLQHLHDFARARRAAPWAVLGVALARVVTMTPPAVTLPPLVGGHGSLNFFVAIVGASGSGKGAAAAAATAAMSVGVLTPTQIGSGEGLTHAFMKRQTKAEGGGVVQHTYEILADVAEVDTIAALNARQGATLQPMLRSAWVGEALGFAYADPVKRLTVPAHCYRLAMVVGVQPKRAAGLLDDVDGGTPQRFTWLPADDPGAPDLAPEEPQRWVWSAPKVPAVDSTGRRPMPVCTTARQAVDSGRLARVRGLQEALDGHALLARLKLAAALGLLDGRCEVSEEDWDLAGTMMAVSDATRATVTATLATVSRDANQARGAAEGERAVVVSDRVEESATRRVARNILRKVRAGKQVGVTYAELRRALSSTQRGNLDDALDLLLDGAQITVEDTTQAPDGRGGGSGRRYRARANDHP